MTKMNPEIKARWVAALRSGRYQQGQGFLNKDGALCCLGVLCDLYDPDAWVATGDGVAHMNDSVSFPPMEVNEWAGFDAMPDEIEVSINGCTQGLADHNDSGRTFLEIADAIEEQL